MLIFKKSKIKKHKNAAKIFEELYVFRDFDFEGILNGFWEGFGMLKSRFGGPKPPKMRSGTHENRYKIEVKKNNEKSKESKGRPPFPRRPTPSVQTFRLRV